MRLMEEEAKDAPTIRPPAQNGLNGNGVHTTNNGDTSDSESDIEEAEPVSATLVLRVVSEPPSPSLSRKSSFRRDQPPAFLNEESRGDTFLQVQVQRSTSSNSLSGSRQHSRSRPPSATPSFYVTDTEGHEGFQVERQKRRSQVSSRDTSRDSSISPSSSMYGLSEIDLHRPNGENSVDFMQKVSDQTKVIQQGLKTLRGEVDNPLRVLDIGQEAIVLSGLNRQAGESLKNIKNLYDETKYLKSYLEKLEAKVHYDMALRRKTAYRPPWYRRLLFISVLVCAGSFAWRRHDQTSFERNMSLLAASGITAYSAAVDFFRGGGTLKMGIVTLQ
eukprot:GFUD01036796.1.p1 GENE.GFUD01036796.1~~GFUD01036796.1.p1  ORF type:complete len:331 (+),score=91.16 GFUD01036796.1:63-1055(+)